MVPLRPVVVRLVAVGADLRPAWARGLGWSGRLGGRVVVRRSGGLGRLGGVPCLGGGSAPGQALVGTLGVVWMRSRAPGLCPGARRRWRGGGCLPVPAQQGGVEALVPAPWVVGL